MDIVESINRYLAGSPVNKGERTRLIRARDEIMRLRTSPQPAQRKSWVSMTPEQHGQIVYAHRTSTDEEFMEAIDTKLRELNEAPARQQNPLGGQRNLVEILAENWRVWPARKVVEQTSLGDVYCSAKGRDLMFGNHEIASDQGSAVVTKEMWSAMREELASKAKEQPAQRTWVGLTEDEAFACKGRDYFETYQAIEAKLKERNT